MQFAFYPLRPGKKVAHFTMLLPGGNFIHEVKDHILYLSNPLVGHPADREGTIIN